ncbi:MAG: metallophosphoesterase family protein [Gemmataceae bacterium]
MRILLVSDLHANRPAVEAIREPFDVCLCLGDLVDYGTEPAPVIDWVRKNALACVRGNHDHMVAQNVVTVGVSGYRYLSGATRPVSRQRVAEPDRKFLASLPVTKYLTLDGLRLLLVHATPRDPLDEYAPPDVELWKRRTEGLGVDMVCVGHTHVPYEIEANGVRVVNPGSVGLPRDGDPRASYVIIENGKVQFRRVEYATEEAVKAIEAAPLPEQAKKMLTQVYRSGTIPNGNHKKPEPAAATTAVG